MAMANGRGAVIEGWDKFDPHHLYGVKPASMVGKPSSGGMPSGFDGSIGPSMAEAGTVKPWHPDSPLFWFGMLLATTLGLIGASTAIRVGPFKAGFTAGKT